MSEILNNRKRHERKCVISTFHVGSKRAFTLVEVLVALVMLSIGLLAVVTAAENARRYQISAVNMFYARQALSDKIEIARALYYERLHTDASLYGSVVEHRVWRTESGATEYYTKGESTYPYLPDGNKVTVSVKDFAAPDIYDPHNAGNESNILRYEVVATVEWKEGEKDFSETFATVIARK